MIRQTGARLARRFNPTKDPLAEDGTEKPADWYDRMYSETAVYQRAYYQSFYYFLWAVIADRLRRSAGRRVIEIGCGPGQLAALLFDQGIVERYAGLDFSSKAIEIARKNVPEGQFFIGDARTTGLHSEVEHDVVICTEVLEHVDDDFAVLSRFRPGKRCIWSVPSFSHPSHVRSFRDGNEVRSRYGPYFHELDVISFISPNSRPGEIYLFHLADGVRCDLVDQRALARSEALAPLNEADGADG